MLAYDRFVLADGPAFYFPMDERAGDAIRDLVSVTSIPMTGYSGQARHACLVLPDGTRAGYFDGTDDRSNGFNTTYHPTDLTIECWLNRMTSSTAFVAAKDANTGSDTEWQLLYVSNTLKFAIGNTASNDYLAPAVDVSPNTWHHVVGVYDNSAPIARLYVDGRLAAVTSAQNGTRQTTGTASVVIGARSNVTLWWTGGIARFAAYSKVLAANRIALHYQAGTAQPRRSRLRAA